ncbi:AsmA family protein [Grimontia sp. NTOU-MAR1]|uniref:AsmA family protein n=1 Tax=Grimontia sp. NTOU-MAR1 TaxID=3111011 RepID=UPI002DC01F2A|nr:AsmA family protein [Grimontia sp. NTOU-MAR1]WRV96587.1 AsmA family protein [Grimontia sp. NTOU-MAR1]
MRVLAKLFASLVIITFVVLGALLIVLNTNYGLPLVQKAVSTLTPYSLRANSLDYNLLAPLSLSLNEPELIELETENTIYQAGYVSVALSLWDSLDGSLSLQSAVVRRAKINLADKAALPASLLIKHLALDDVAYQSNTFAFDHADIQVSNWRNTQDKWGSWQGQFQLSAPSLSIDGQTLSNLLLDSELIDGTWEIWGLSFNSEFGNITGSATVEDRKVMLHQLTLSDARIEPSRSLSNLTAMWGSLSEDYDIAIKRLDLLDVSASVDDFTLEHLNLSAQSVNLLNGELAWAANDASSLLSFNANLINFDKWLLTDVLAEMSLSPSRIEVGAFSSKIDDEGYISFAGDMTPASLSLRSLVLNGLTLELESGLSKTLSAQWERFDNIRVGSLSIRHTNVTAPNPEFPLQVIGLNLKGKDLLLRQASHNGMWRGQLTGSAKAASVNRILVSSPYAAMSVEDGLWQLDPLSLTFQQGQLAAKASVDFSSPSRQWHFEGTGLSLPTSLYSRWLGLNLPLEGEHDLTVHISALGGDTDSLAYSLTGDLKATPHRTVMQVNDGESFGQSLMMLFSKKLEGAEHVDFPINVGEVVIAADRGRIGLAPTSLEQGGTLSTLSGQWDLVSGEGNLSHTNQ